MLYDLHVHLNLVENAVNFVASETALGVGGSLSCGVTPKDYEQTCQKLGDLDSVRIGLGLHPWWIADKKVAEDDLELFESLAPHCDYIGEVGLDRTKHGLRSFEEQTRWIARCLAACRKPGTLFSFHGSRCVGLLMDLIDAVGLPDGAQVIFHWFNSSFEDLKRAIDRGYYFSINEWMLQTKRGRAYSAVIPAQQLLLETDGPSERKDLRSPEAFARNLQQTLNTLEILQKRPLEALVAQTSGRLLKLDQVC